MSSHGNRIEGRWNTGERVVIEYTRNGVRWQHGAATADDGISGKGSQPPGRAQPHAEPIASANGLSAAASLLGVAAAAAGPAAALVGSVVAVLNWWERHQYRLMDQAGFEEDRRIPWTFDMVARWAAVHQSRDKLDLRISHYLGRECNATLEALVSTPKMGVPHALLYDLELIRDSIACSRRLLARQFELLRSMDFKFAVPNHKPLASGLNPEFVRLNYDLVARIGKDPAGEWDFALASQDPSSFENDLREMSRSPGNLISEVLAPQQLAVRNESGSGYAAEFGKWLMANLATVWSISDPGGLLVDSLYWQYLEYKKIKNLARRDDFRELLLLQAEIERTRVLHKIWLMAEESIRSASADKAQPFLVEHDGLLAIATRGNNVSLLASESGFALVAAGQIEMADRPEAQ